MAHMNRSARLRKTALLLVVVGLSVLSAATLAGQSPFAPEQGPVDLILKKLDAILEAVAAPPPPEPSEVILHTSAATTPLDTFVECVATNVSTRTIEIVARRRLNNGNSDFSQTFTLQPRQTDGFGLTTSLAVHPHRRCEFTFTGFANEVRANMFVRSNATGIAGTVFEAR